jgi:outer membrane protein, multidrug efflux system
MKAQLIEAVRAVGVMSLVVIASGCAMLDEFTQKFNPRQTVAETKLPDNWRAPLPHGGELNNLNEFWQRYPNPVLLELINSAQQHAPTLATALANLADAKTNRVRANAARLPKLDANASASRALQQPKDMEFSGGQSNFGIINVPVNTTQVGLQAAWELDLYGANKSLRDAAILQENAAKAGWHEARVAIAAEVATSYFNYTLCQQQSVFKAQIAQSHAETAHLTEIAFNAGFSDSAKVAMAQANHADARQQATEQAGQCEVEIKNMVALTFMDEQAVREKLADAEVSAPKLDLDKLFIISEVPSQALAQRPDVYRAELDLVSAAANVKKAAADRLPKVTLNGSIGWMRMTSDLFESQGRVWSLGPVSVSLPIFDGGALAASKEAADARYVEAAAKYRGVIQTAVKETESALVNLHSTGERQKNVMIALQKLTANNQAIETRYKAGFASKIEVEETKRALMSAQNSALALQQSRANAWLNLYRAAGGGWEQNMPISAQDNKQVTGLEANQYMPSSDVKKEEIMHAE